MCQPQRALTTPPAVVAARVDACSRTADLAPSRAEATRQPSQATPAAEPVQDAQGHATSIAPANVLQERAMMTEGAAAVGWHRATPAIGGADMPYNMPP